MEYKYLTHEEINQLKEGLTSKSRNKNRIKKKNGIKRDNPRISKSIASISNYHQFRNDEIAQDFEENIRQILMNEYKWKAVPIIRKFSYRDIQINEDIETIITNDLIKFNINNKEIQFELKDDNILSMTYNNETEEITDQNETTKYKEGIKIEIGELTQVENDGLFKIKNFSLEKFDKNEINILYNNVGDVNNFKYASTEIKYTKTNLEELVKQLYRNKKVFEKFIPKAEEKSVYMGIFRANNIKKEEILKYETILEKLKCVIICLKNPIFAQKRIDKFIDWQQIKENNEKFRILEEKMNKRINDLNERIDDLEERMNNRINDLEEKMDKSIKGLEEKMDKIIKDLEKKLNNLEEKMHKKIGNLNIRVNQMQNQLSKK